MGYSISEMARWYGLEPSTIRYYEKEGLIAPSKSPKGVRCFSEGDADQLGMVCCLKSTGMSIRDIRLYIDLCAQGDGTIEQRLEIFEHHREHILEEVASLQKNLSKIEGKIANYQKKHSASLRKERGMAAIT